MNPARIIELVEGLAKTIQRMEQDNDYPNGNMPAAHAFDVVDAVRLELDKPGETVSVPKGMTRNCRSCRFLHIEPDRRGRRIARKDKSYRCTYQVPDYPMPVSLTKSFEFVPMSKQRGTWVLPTEGDTCPTWQPREDKS